jgi:hypothetical protein
MRHYLNENIGFIGSFSGFWAWAQSLYPIMKGFIGELSFWAGVILCAMALIDRIRKSESNSK